VKKKTGKRASRHRPISRPLRKAIRERGLTAYGAAKQAGVSVDAVQRFLNDQRGLTLATADKLATALALTLCPDDRPATGGRSESDRTIAGPSGRGPRRGRADSKGTIGD
jgi:hypothetical protein